MEWSKLTASDNDATIKLLPVTSKLKLCDDPSADRHAIAESDPHNDVSQAVRPVRLRDDWSEDLRPIPDNTTLEAPGDEAAFPFGSSLTDISYERASVTEAGPRDPEVTMMVTDWDEAIAARQVR